MAHTKVKTSKIVTTISLTPDNHHKLVKLARLENRTLSNYLETIIQNKPFNESESAA